MQPPKNVFMQTVKLRQELREQKEMSQNLYPKLTRRAESPVLSNRSSQSPTSTKKRKKINSINRDLLVMAAAIDQTITNKTRETLSTPDEKEERLQSRLAGESNKDYIPRHKSNSGSPIKNSGKRKLSYSP